MHIDNVKFLILSKFAYTKFSEKPRISYVKAIVMMGMFTFVFLGAEYLFVNMISRSVSGNKAVMAQNYGDRRKVCVNDKV